MFNSIKQGNLLYILEKGEGLSYKIGQVMNVSNPHPRKGSYAMPNNYGVNTEMFVDIQVKVGDDTINLEELDINQEIAYSGNLIVSDNKNVMISEVEGMMCNSRRIVESIQYHENVIKSCDMILRELNPQLAKEKEHEEKIMSLEGKMNNIENTLSNMMGMLSKALGKSNTKNKEE